MICWISRLLQSKNKKNIILAKKLLKCGLHIRKKNVRLTSHVG
nr:MAG TPA: hypothetical protein [Caudoviricetes sp.]